ncbi:hypothetical protein [Oceanicoccus sp. KOV_DT_Chl]|uniref:hypothetical protein n=1 Tax=Oceanicoccus sp. KOV_DT_Chl TaxID=1904639 RepID=UPI000C7D0F29|nr:hypothetical protein [Oceanicoccus sp. KOV_DT_Chl]
MSSIDIIESDLHKFIEDFFQNKSHEGSEGFIKVLINEANKKFPQPLSIQWAPERIRLWPPYGKDLRVAVKKYTPELMRLIKKHDIEHPMRVEVITLFFLMESGGIVGATTIKDRRGKKYHADVVSA